MARAALVATGALLLACGGAAVGYAVTRHATGGLSPQAKGNLSATASALDAEINAARTAVHARALTLASLQQVQAAIVTNPTTAKDMLAGGELKFDPQPGEVVELRQSKGGASESLLIEPETSTTTWPAYTAHSGKLGSSVDLAGGGGKQLLVMDVVEVKPKQMADTIVGSLSIARPIDLQPAIDRLSGAGLAGWLEVGALRTDFGAAPRDATVDDIVIAAAPATKLHV